ncbi:hypothetical protein L7F22_007227 [Adiantum nelumboides]|nr:hypothetical protein [Adiantum nelumboides]
MSTLMDNGEQARPKRMQGVSCDACKFRKVKCDRRAKIERKREEHANRGLNLDHLEDDVACSVCTAHGLRCTFTSVTKRRRGRRIVEIQRGQLEGLPGSGKDEAHGGDDDDFDEGALKRGERRKPSDTTRGAIEGPSPVAGSSRGGGISLQPASKGLFQVSGLTRALLDACVMAYFRYSAPCMPILHVDSFQARYAAFFAIYEGNYNMSVPNVEHPSYGDQLQPISEILLLAVACIGAGLLEPPIAEVGSSAKFQLQERIALRFQEHLRHDGWGDDYSSERTDVIEAVYIMSDPQLAILDEDEPFAGWDVPADYRDKFKRSPRDPLRLSPTSHEAVVRLMFKLGINRRPKRRKDCPPGDDRVWEALDGSYVSEREVFRRVRIFWSAFCQDTFRSFGQRRSPLINDDDYDQDLPRWLPRNDGDFNAYFFADATREKTGQHGDDLAAFSTEFSPFTPSRFASADPSPASWGIQVPRFSRFDAYQLETMLRMAFIVRAVSIRFVSPRSQGRGVLTSDVERAVFSFKAWRAQLPSEVTWEVQSAPLFVTKRMGKHASSNMVAMRNSLKTLFLESLYLGQVLGTWAAVDDFGLRIDVDVTEAAHMFAIKLGMNTSGTSTIPGAPRRSQMAPEDVRRKVRAQLDELVAASFFRIAKVHKEAAELGLLRANRSVLMNVASAYCVWGCGLASHLLKASGGGLQSSMPSPSTSSSGPTEINGPSLTAADVLSKAEDLIVAVASCDSAKTLLRWSLSYA